MDAPARDVVGSLDWAGASNGNLSTRERLGLLGAIARTTAQYLVGRTRLALGLRRPDAGRLDLERLELPDSPLARLAEQESRETLTPTMVNHSFRTFVFGLALSKLDGVDVDVEQLYVASLLHDIALESPEPGRCFAVRGGERAREVCVRAGAADSTAWAIAEAITAHITPGGAPELGPLGPAIAGGAMVDLVGLRLWELEKEFVETTLARWPRLGCTAHLVRCWRAEAAAVPQGRAAAVERMAMFSLFVRMGPLGE